MARQNGKSPSILSVDPGETVGLALWNARGECLRNWTMDLDSFIDWCDGFDSGLSIIVYEDYITDHRARRILGSRNAASQAIGALKLLARRHKAKLVRQRADKLRITAMHAEIKIPATGHIPDATSAYLHGFYYLEQAGIVKPIAQRH